MPKPKLGSGDHTFHESAQVGTGYFVIGIAFAIGVGFIPMLIGGLLEALADYEGVCKALAISTGIVLAVLIGNWIIEQLFPIRKEPEAFEGMTGWPVNRSRGREQDDYHFRPGSLSRIP